MAASGPVGASRSAQSARPPARRVRRRVLTVALVVIGGLLAGVALLWAFQRRLIFQPDTAAVPPASSLLADAVDVTLTTDDGLSLRALYVPAPGASVPGVSGSGVSGSGIPGSGAAGQGAAGSGTCRPTVLVAPGNAGNRAGRVPLAQALQDAGFGVLLLEYRGYGGNPGSPTEDGLLADARAAVAYLTGPAGLSPREVIYLGESLGGAVVTRLAVDAPPVGVLLRSPFTELADVAQRQFPVLPVRMLLRDRFPVASLIGDVDAPVTVVYGSADTLVPPELSRTVAAAGSAVEVSVAGAEHNDPSLVAGPVLIDAVVDLARRAGCAPG